MGHWVWRAYCWGFSIEYEVTCCWGFEAAKYGLIEVFEGYMYGLATKYKWDGLDIVIFWKIINVLDGFHVKLHGDSFWENSYLL